MRMALFFLIAASYQSALFAADQKGCAPFLKFVGEFEKSTPSSERKIETPKTEEMPREYLTDNGVVGEAHSEMLQDGVIAKIKNDELGAQLDQIITEKQAEAAAKGKPEVVAENSMKISPTNFIDAEQLAHATKAKTDNFMFSASSYVKPEMNSQSLFKHDALIAFAREYPTETSAQKVHADFEQKHDMIYQVRYSTNGEKTFAELWLYKGDKEMGRMGTFTISNERILDPMVLSLQLKTIESSVTWNPNSAFLNLFYRENTDLPGNFIADLKVDSISIISKTVKTFLENPHTKKKAA